MPCPFLLAIERVELLCEAGNTLVSSHQATQLMHPFRHLPQTAINLLQKPMGFFSDISATAVYPPDVVAMPPDSEEFLFPSSVILSRPTTYLLAPSARTCTFGFG